jgi:hypothetical protein
MISKSNEELSSVERRQRRERAQRTVPRTKTERGNSSKPAQARRSRQRRAGWMEIRREREKKQDECPGMVIVFS